MNITLTPDEIKLIIDALEHEASSVERERHEKMTLENMKTDKGKDDIQAITNKIHSLNSLILRISK